MRHLSADIGKILEQNKKREDLVRENEDGSDNDSIKKRLSNQSRKKA